MFHAKSLLPLAALTALVVGCGGGEPERIDGGTTVRTNGADDSRTNANGEVQGRSFTDVGPTDNIASTAEANVQAPTAGGGLPNDVGIGNVNPNIAQALRADPGQMAAGAIDGLVTFGDLSLVGVDLDSLLDYLYKPETELAKSFEFPAKVKAMAGDDKALVGYMIPLEYKPKSDDIVIFMLVRDLMSCCFGGMPRPDEWVYVEMKDPKVAQLFPYVPVVVRGELIVGRLEDEFGFATGVYTMHADSVEAFRPPAVEDTSVEESDGKK